MNKHRRRRPPTPKPLKRLLALPRRVWFSLSVPILLLALGTVGYRLIEGPHWSVFDALYMTAISLTTVGFLEVHELSTAGRVFTIFLCFGGIFTLFYTATEIIRSIVSGEFQHIVGRERMAQALEDMRGHVIVCGYGRMGQKVCAEFERGRVPFVVIDADGHALKDFRSECGAMLEGDATDDPVLKRAGVERAKSLVTVLSSDAGNLYITLSARLLNDKLVIVARAEDEDAAEKLKRVGASQVISPYLIGGHRIAQAVVRPSVVNFLELATANEHVEIQIEEVKLSASSSLVGRTLRDSRVHQDFGIMVVAILSPEGRSSFNPQADTQLVAGATLIALGHRDQLDQLAAIAGSPAAG